MLNKNITSPNKKLIHNIEYYMYGNPSTFNTLSNNQKILAIDCIGADYFTEIECFDEAFDKFRKGLEESNTKKYELLSYMKHFFNKAYYHNQMPYNKYDMEQLYSKIFDEKVLSMCLNDSNFMWNWCLESLKKLNYK